MTLARMFLLSVRVWMGRRLLPAMENAHPLEQVAQRGTTSQQKGLQAAGESSPGPFTVVGAL